MRGESDTTLETPREPLPPKALGASKMCAATTFRTFHKALPGLVIHSVNINEPFCAMTEVLRPVSDGWRFF